MSPISLLRIYMVVPNMIGKQGGKIEKNRLALAYNHVQDFSRQREVHTVGTLSNRSSAGLRLSQVVRPCAKPVEPLAVDPFHFRAHRVGTRLWYAL